MEFRVVLPIAA